MISAMSTKQAILPVFCLAVAPIATAIRMTRSSMLEVMRQDYIRTAWSKGLKERSVIMSHALKNGLIPVITMKGMSLAHIVGGSVIIETVFSIPGNGPAGRGRAFLSGLYGGPGRHDNGRGGGPVRQFAGRPFLRLAGPANQIFLNLQSSFNREVAINGCSGKTRCRRYGKPPAG